MAKVLLNLEILRDKQNVALMATSEDRDTLDVIEKILTELAERIKTTASQDNPNN